VQAHPYKEVAMPATTLKYTGYAIVVIDGGDYGAIAYTGPGDGSLFTTDEQAVAWAAERFPKGTWSFAALTTGEAS
jgi:hypothetical protein